MGGGEQTQSIETPVTSAVNIKAPDPLDFQKPENWKSWITRFERYMSVANLNSRPDKEKVDLLCYTMGAESEEILLRLLPVETNRVVYKTVKEKFDGYFLPKKNVVFERYKFNARIQQPGEPVDTFITALYSLAEKCEYADLKDSLIRDRIVIGVLDKKLSERLQLTPDLTVDKATTAARQAEMLFKEGEAMRSSAGAPQVNKLGFKKTQQQRGDNQRNTRESSSTGNTSCTRCGLRRHQDGKKCPATNSACRKCKKIGHWDSVCKSNLVRCVDERSGSDTESETEDAYFLGSLGYKNRKSEKYYTSFFVNEFGKELEFFLDTGADVTCVPSYCVPASYLKKLQRPDKPIFSADGKRLNVLGTLTLNFSYKQKNVKVTAYIVKGIKTCILSRERIEEYGFFVRVNKIGEGVRFDPVSRTSVNVEQEFPKIFDGLGTFKEKLHIRLKDNARPFAQFVPRTVPIPLLDKIEDELKHQVKMGVLAPVDEPTEWCSPMVPVPKANGEKVRICGAFTELNKNVLRPVHPVLKVDVSLARMRKAKFFSRIDVKAGYNQIELTEESQLLTTIITPFGRFKHKRVPFGINCASDYFVKKFAEISTGIKNVIIHVDDVLIYAETTEQHDETLRSVLDKLAKAGVTLNKDKCVFGATQIEFLGHIVSQNGIDVHPDRVSAIVEFPRPENVDSLRQFLGIVTFAGKYIPNRSELLEPLNALLHKGVQFVWSDAQEKAFQSTKEYLSKAPTLALYDLSKPTIVQADASSFGVGGALIQVHDCERRVVAYASRSLSPTERRYSQIEKEALSLAYASVKFKDYITGLDITLETDHKPLVQILQTKPVDELTPRLQRIRIRMMRFNYNVVYVPGKTLVLADALSRNVKPGSDTERDDLESETEKYVQHVIDSLPATTMLDKIRVQQENDFTCQTLKRYCTQGWPEQSKLSDELHPYHAYKDNISYAGGYVLYNSRLVIPPSLQLEIIGKIHQGHLGINKCRERAKQSVWWIGLSTQLKNMITNCPQCVEGRVNYKEEFVSEEFPDRPWQRISIDLFKHNQWYVILTDYYTRFIEIQSLKSMTEQDIISVCKTIFARFGIPEIVRSDNGPQFSTEFKKFACSYDFKHITSSPHYPQSNGCIEAAVKIAKNILKKSDDVNLGLLAYRTTPLENGFSPAELMFSRKIRSSLPVIPKQLGTFHSHEKIAKKESERKCKQAEGYNKRHRSKNLSTLKIGDSVWITDLRVYGTVTQIDPLPNSYWVQTEKSVIRRNRWQLIPAPYKEPQNTGKNSDEYICVPPPPDVLENEEHENENTRHEGFPSPPNCNVNNPANDAPNLECNPRPERNRRPPAWAKDYVT